LKENNKILVTGAAGFIGSALICRLFGKYEQIIGLDNLNTYYDIDLKINRLNTIKKKNAKGDWTFEKCDLANKEHINSLIKKYKPDTVVNLAAQAGVRYSIDYPHEYIRSNILGFSNLIDACKENKVNNFIYASSSSVYGGNLKMPFHEDDKVDQPLSLYAASKKSNELIAHSYSHVYGIPCTGLRLFTVYGPWGRPDMAPMIFTKAIINGDPIDVFNNGNMKRDFTYIDDVIDGIIECCKKPPLPNKKSSNDESYSSSAPYRVFNIGNSQPVQLLEFIRLLQKEIGKDAIINYKPMQIGDVASTFADISKVKKCINFSPKVSIEDGLKFFVSWYKEYYKIKI
jgi:UDP-glucuronate 4-epimerase